MKLNRAGVAAGVLIAAAAFAACSSSGNSSKNTNSATNSGGASPSTGGSAVASTVACSSGTLNAEGSTAQTNAINQWIKDYQTACLKTNPTVNYNPTGSGAGVSKFTAGQVDFAGSDSALDPTKGEFAAAKKRCGSAPLDLPMVVGPIALAYNLKNVKDPVVLNGEVAANIFLGKIKSWDDPAIKALNKNVSLPATKISVFYRSDSSGTTQNFERYLAATAPSIFTSKPDKDSSKAGFAGQGQAKSQGVADAISKTDGAIGYTEFSFAASSGLQTASIDNGGGPVVLSKNTASKAAEAATVTGTGNDLSLKIDYATKTPGAYPLILVTYEIACTKYTDPAKATFVKDFLNYSVDGGQAALPKLGYAPLPTSLQAKVKASISTIG
ncbi:MAG: phosphate ABC transporter substrate-binding protein PstS [Jatrophihabitans sp.]